MRRGFRDEILTQARRKEMKINQREIKIVKDIPWRIREKRQNYKLITRCLQENKIEYRWIIPEGIFFLYQGQRFKINSIFKAKEFLKKHATELGYISSGEESEEEQEQEDRQEAEETVIQPAQKIEDKKKKRKQKQVDKSDRELRNKTNQ